MTPEGKVKLRVKQMLKRYQAYYFMPVQNGYGKPGLDFHGCHKGRAFAVETKAPGKTLTSRQEQTIAEMRASGMKVFVIGEHVNTTDSPFGEFFSGQMELEAWLLELIS